MKAIHNKVNIVPVIAKADTLTLKERERLKKRVSVTGGAGGRLRGGGAAARDPWSPGVWPSQRAHAFTVGASALSSDCRRLTCRLHDAFGKCRDWKRRCLREVLLFQPNGSLPTAHLGACADYSSLQWSPGLGLAIRCGIAVSVSRCASHLPAAPALAACLCGASSLSPQKPPL